MKRLLTVFFWVLISYDISAQNWDSLFQVYQKKIESQSYQEAFYITNDLLQIAYEEIDSALVYKSMLLKINIEIELDSISLKLVQNDLDIAFKYAKKDSGFQCAELFSLKARLNYYNKDFNEAINNQIKAIDCFANEWGTYNIGYFTELYNLFYANYLNQTGKDLDFYADQMCDLFIYGDSIEIPNSKYDLALKMGEYYKNRAQYEKAKKMYFYASSCNTLNEQNFVAKYQLAEVFIHLEEYKEAFYYINDLKNKKKSLTNEQLSAIFYLQALLEYYQGNFSYSINSFEESIKLFEMDSANLATTYFSLSQCYLYYYLEDTSKQYLLEKIKFNLNKCIQYSQLKSVNNIIKLIPFQIQLIPILHDLDLKKINSQLDNIITSGEVANYHLAQLYKSKADLFHMEGEYDSVIVNLRKALLEFQSVGYDQSIEYLSTIISYVKYSNFKNGAISNENLYEIYRIIINLTKINFNVLSQNERFHYYQRINSQICKLINSNVIFNDDLFNEVFLNLNIFSKSILLEINRKLDLALAKSINNKIKEDFIKMKNLRKLYSKLQSENFNDKDLLESYKFQADSLDKILINNLGEYAASKRMFEITWKDVQSNLNVTEASVEFARYYSEKDSSYRYMALVVRPNFQYPKLITLGCENQISKAISSKNFIGLYDLVWRDIDTLLTGVKSVYYSPAGELNNVAFSALCYDGNETQLALNTNQSSRGVVIQSEKGTLQTCTSVLMDKYELHQLTTTRYLADGTLNNQKSLAPIINLFGGINYDMIPTRNQAEKTEESNEDFAFHANLNKMVSRSSSSYGQKMPYLPGTKEEVSNIASLLKNASWQVNIATEKLAGEYDFKNNLEEKAPGILHIATHGFTFPNEEKKRKLDIELNQTNTYKLSEDPMVRCGLMLSGSNISWTGNPQQMIKKTGDDGILTAAEVLNMDLSNTKLVVLSACETGLGKIEGSEGVFGLMRGFKLAGVEQMIVSLWSVPDKETMELMTLFYSDLVNTSNPVISFEKAQKEMRNKYPNEPEKWAGFVLVR